MFAKIKLVFAVSVSGLIFSGCSFFNETMVVCGDDLVSSNAALEKKMVSFENIPSSNFFYVTNIENGFVILMRPDAVTNYLQSSIEEYEVYKDRILLNEIVSDLPLSTDVDLYSYAIRDPRLLQRPQFIVGDLLEKGQVSVLDLWRTESENVLKSAQQIDIEYGGLEKEFCSNDGRSIYRVIYEIWD